MTEKGSKMIWKSLSLVTKGKGDVLAPLLVRQGLKAIF